MPVIRKRTISEEVSMLSDVRRKMFSEQSKPTNADRIRAMSDEELADNMMDLFVRYGVSVWCDERGPCQGNAEFDCTNRENRKCALRWLQQPAEVASDVLMRPNGEEDA